MQKQTQPAEPVRKANGSIWDNRFFLGIVSVLAAVLVWMVVSTFLDPQGSFVIKDVSVNYGYQSTIYTSKGLDIVDQQAVDNVQVQADGNGTLIGKLSSSDIMVYPVYNGVQGAGKTTLIREIVARLGADDTVTSPTFAIVNQYTTREGKNIYHFDFYRINRLEEAYDFGYEEYFYSGDLCLVEWPEKIEELLPEEVMTVRIAVGGDEERTMEID